jgi:hypothetical protein
MDVTCGATHRRRCASEQRNAPGARASAATQKQSTGRILPATKHGDVSAGGSTGGQGVVATHPATASLQSDVATLEAARAVPRLDVETATWPSAAGAALHVQCPAAAARCITGFDAHSARCMTAVGGGELKAAAAAISAAASCKQYRTTCRIGAIVAAGTTA